MRVSKTEQKIYTFYRLSNGLIVSGSKSAQTYKVHGNTVEDYTFDSFKLKRTKNVRDEVSYEIWFRDGDDVLTTTTLHALQMMKICGFGAELRTAGKEYTTEEGIKVVQTLLFIETDSDNPEYLFVRDLNKYVDWLESFVGYANRLGFDPVAFHAGKWMNATDAKPRTGMEADPLVASRFPAEDSDLAPPAESLKEGYSSEEVEKMVGKNLPEIAPNSEVFPEEIQEPEEQPKGKKGKRGFLGITLEG